MKNKEITIYELIGLIKDNKAPKNIKYQGEEYIYIGGDYQSIEDDSYLMPSIHILEVLNDTVEIIPEENGYFFNNRQEIIDYVNNVIKKENNDWEDLEEICNSDLTFEQVKIHYSYAINQLIKNQKYLKERLDKNE